MGEFTKLVIFITATIGMTNIIVDPAAIARPFRDFIDKRMPSFFSKLFSCYQCSGTWVGFIFGYIIFSSDPFIIFLCGMAGSYLCTISATYMNYLEARSIIGVEEDV